MDPTQSLRKEVDRILSGQGAHADFDAAVAGLPPKLRGVKPEGAPHSAWELLEHLRLAQWDMLEFSRDAKHASPEWPEGYWPKTPEPESNAAWDRSVKAFQRDLQAMRDLVVDPKSDLFTPLPHGDGQTLLREALQLADHNAYHVGELIFLRRVLGAWK
jgi:DinB superfamily